MAETTEPTVAQVMALLATLYYDLHPVYANTSRRGGGIGGQSMSQQCNVIDPNPAELNIMQDIEAMLHGYVTGHPEFVDLWQSRVAMLRVQNPHD